MSNIAISELNTSVTSLDSDDLILVSKYNDLNSTYTSGKMKYADLLETFMRDISNGGLKYNDLISIIRNVISQEKDEEVVTGGSTILTAYTSNNSTGKRVNNTTWQAIPLNYGQFDFTNYSYTITWYVKPETSTSVFVHTWLGFYDPSKTSSNQEFGQKRGSDENMSRNIPDFVNNTDNTNMYAMCYSTVNPSSTPPSINRILYWTIKRYALNQQNSN